MTNRNRYLLLQTGIWLVFLVNPLIMLYLMDLPSWQRVVGAVIVIVFGVVYMLAHSSQVDLPPGGWLVILTVLAAGLTWIIGPAATVTLPYIASVASSLLSLRGSMSLILIFIGIYGVYAFSLGTMHSWFYFGFAAIISLIVGIQVSTELLHEEELSLAAELELSRQRETIYRDVHDLLGHSLTVINVKASLARRLVDVDKHRAAQELDGIVEISRSSLDDVRGAVRATHTPSLAVELDTARSALQAAGIDARISADHEAESPLFGWVLREAVTNVLRHSHATECEITVTPDKLVVSDNGVGIAPGVQLASIAGRVHAAGGEVRLPPTDSGTRLEVTV